jgi:hypothetical protein
VRAAYSWDLLASESSSLTVTHLASDVTPTSIDHFIFSIHFDFGLSWQPPRVLVRLNSANRSKYK